MRVNEFSILIASSFALTIWYSLRLRHSHKLRRQNNRCLGRIGVLCRKCPKSTRICRFRIAQFYQYTPYKKRHLTHIVCFEQYFSILMIYFIFFERGSRLYRNDPSGTILVVQFISDSEAKGRYIVKWSVV